MKKDFANTINNSQKLTPTFYATLTDYVIDGKVVLHVHIPESANVHRCCGRIYDRNEDGDYDVTDNTQIVADMRIHGRLKNRLDIPCKDNGSKQSCRCTSMDADDRCRIDEKCESHH